MSFEKVIGYENVKNELNQIIDMFKNKDLYENMGAKLPRNILLYGDPGLGKTLIAESLIKECNVKSYIIRKNKDTENSIKEIEEVFKDASNQTSTILIDDIDKFSESDKMNVDDQTFVAIQSAIDSVKDKNVLLIATANNFRKLPDSLLRSGRFDRIIKISTPTYEDAAKIIEYYMKDKKVDKNINYEDIAKMISYSSCANLEKILNESSINAAYNRKEYIEIEDIVKSYTKDTYRIKSNYQDPDDREIDITAYHECGHLVVAEAIKNGCIGFVSINPKGERSLEGFTKFAEEFTRRPENVLTALAGKAAVELFYEGRCGSGCQSDLGKAYQLIKDGIETSGTSGFSYLSFGDDCFNESDYHKFNIKTLINSELEHFMFKVKDILIKNKDLFFEFVSKLKEKKYLLYSDIKSIRERVGINNTIVQ